MGLDRVEAHILATGYWARFAAERHELVEQEEASERSVEGDGDDQGQGEHVVLRIFRFPDFVIEVACRLREEDGVYALRPKFNEFLEYNQRRLPGAVFEMLA